MSTKTTFKRISLITVAALSFGLLSSVTPASAVATGLVASVGPNGATSLTVVGSDSTSTGALVRLDVTSSDSGTPAPGLLAGETITASITAVPTASGKTLIANGGSMADTTTAVGTNGRGDFVVLESTGQTDSTPGTTILNTTSSPTDWTKLATTLPGAINDSATAPNAFMADGQIGSVNSGFKNMDTNHELLTAQFTKSYYVTIRPRSGSNVIDQGAYTFSFQLTDVNGVVRATKTVKIDFVSTNAKSDAVLALAQSGSFSALTAVATQDTASAAFVKLTLTNRDGGLVRTNSGANPVPSVQLQTATTAEPTFKDSATVTVNDAGTYGSDFGRDSTTSPGNGSLQKSDGVYGLVFTTGVVNTTTGLAYRVWAGFGNATIVTSALTLYTTAAATAAAASTDVLLTAAGLSAADQLPILNTSGKNFTIPVTTKSATFKFTIQTSSETNTAGAAITVVPTWSGPVGSSSVTPATSTTGTVYTSDAAGNFTVTVTNSAPVDTAKLTLVLTSLSAFQGTSSYTVTLTYAAAAATSITVIDPVTGVFVKTGSTNATTVSVMDQFGNPISGQSVSVTLSATSANYSATVTIAPITTNAAGTATYSLVGGATTATLDALTFACVPTACGTAATMTYNYVTTVPAVATMTAEHGLTWGTANIITPATGIYSSGTTMLILNGARNISKSLLSATDAATTNDEVALRFRSLTSGSVAAEGAVVTVTAGVNGHIVDGITGLPVKTRNLIVGSDGYTPAIRVLATGTGDVVFTATSGTTTATATLKIAGSTATAGRTIAITAAATGTAFGSGVPVTVMVTDRYGNPVSGVALNVVASGVGTFAGGSITNSFTTDASGSYTFLANSAVSDGGVAVYSATTGTVGSFNDAAGLVGATKVDATLVAGNVSASQTITFAAGQSASDVAQAALDAAAEATDAANAATDAANAAAEAADAATAAAQDAADAVAALSTQVAEQINALKMQNDALRKQLVAITNLIIKIQKKVKA